MIDARQGLKDASVFMSIQEIEMTFLSSFRKNVYQAAFVQST